jgi:hypothetical protein
VKISCLPESLNFGLRKIHDSIYYALPHAGKAMSNFYGPSSSPTPSSNLAEGTIPTTLDPTVPNPSESPNKLPAMGVPEASIEKRSLPEELLAQIKFLGDLKYIRGGMFTKNSEGQDVFTKKQLDGVKIELLDESSLPAPLLDSAEEKITTTIPDPTVPNPSESPNKLPATEAPNASIEKRSLPEELLAQI